jgi:hypothetical protein
VLHDFVVVQPAECAWRSNEQNARSVFVKERTRAKAYWKALEFVSAHKQHLVLCKNSMLLNARAISG